MSISLTTGFMANISITEVDCPYTEEQIERLVEEREKEIDFLEAKDAVIHNQKRVATAFRSDLKYSAGEIPLPGQDLWKDPVVCYCRENLGSVVQDHTDFEFFIKWSGGPRIKVSSNRVSEWIDPVLKKRIQKQNDFDYEF